jgi:hypothetical protein
MKELIENGGGLPEYKGECCEFFSQNYMRWNKKAENECTYFFRDTPMLF